MKILQLYALIVCIAGELHDQLHYFETLHHVDVKVRRKRSLDHHGVETKDVSFSAFGKDFNLVLTPGSPVISAEFKANLVYRDGRSAPLFVNENNFFTGHLSDKEDVEADAHMEDGLWTANVYDQDDVYTLEPSWRHLPPSDNHSMIVYRHSDIKWNNMFPDSEKNPSQKKKVCGALHPEDEMDSEDIKNWERENMRQSKNTTRYKRDTSQNMCHIIAVADFTFFEGPGGGFPHRTANYIIHNMQTVNRIYTQTVWNTGKSGLGFQIKELRIHPEYTDKSSYHINGRHYNMPMSSWGDHDLLKQFGEDKVFHEFCLAHLFTHRQFAGGVLGLAYIASPRKNALGGICSSRSRFSRNNLPGSRALNTGFSSTKNTKGYNLLTQEADLVTAHEFGHNWGSEHDAETSECAPDSFNDGKFIMYPYAVSGYEDNNNNFSPCSKRYITAVLSSRQSSCFKEAETKDDGRFKANVPMCGNGIIDKGEECDGGGMGVNGLDPCCSKDCTFLGDAVCSSVNFECCFECQMAPSGTLCRGESKELCQEAAYCSGLSMDCPKSGFMNDTACVDHGTCVNGVCLDFCSYEGIIQNPPKTLRSCRCEDSDTACLRCCKAPGERCQPYGRTPVFLSDGRPCSYGYCEGGKCQEGKANMIQRLFNFIERLDSSTFVAFMKSNIVGTIIVFSLFIWIPASWTVSCIDKRNERKAKEKDERWVSEILLNHSLQSNVLSHKLDDYKIKEADFRHWPPPQQGRESKRPVVEPYTFKPAPHHEKEFSPPLLEENIQRSSPRYSGEFVPPPLERHVQRSPPGQRRNFAPLQYERHARRSPPLEEQPFLFKNGSEKPETGVLRETVM